MLPQRKPRATEGWDVQLLDSYGDTVMTMLTHPTKCVFDCCPSGVCFPFVVDFGQFITKRKKKEKEKNQRIRFSTNSVIVYGR
jgi:hypothetical protein